MKITFLYISQWLFEYRRNIVKHVEVMRTVVNNIESLQGYLEDSLLLQIVMTRDMIDTDSNILPRETERVGHIDEFHQFDSELF